MYQDLYHLASCPVSYFSPFASASFLCHHDLDLPHLSSGLEELLSSRESTPICCLCSVCSVSDLNVYWTCGRDICLITSIVLLTSLPLMPFLRLLTFWSLQIGPLEIVHSSCVPPVLLVTSDLELQVTRSCTLPWFTSCRLPSLSRR